MRLSESFQHDVQSTAGTLLACTASCIIAGCVSVRPLASDVPFELGPGEGILVVHVRTDSPVVSLEFNGAQAASDLSEGEHLLLLGVSEGRYRWSEVTLGAARFKIGEERNASRTLMTFTERSRHPVTFVLGRGKTDFRVEAGRINYVGMILLDRTGIRRLMAMPIDRTASALAQLRERYPDALERYPVVYSGPARHVFLDRYQTARDAAAGGESKRPSVRNSP